MTTADQLNAIHLDWANGKVTLSQALWEAYATGYGDAYDKGWMDAKDEADLEIREIEERNG